MNFNVADYHFVINIKGKKNITLLPQSFTPFHVEKDVLPILFILSVVQYCRPEKGFTKIGEFYSGNTKHTIYQNNNFYYIKIYNDELLCCNLQVNKEFSCASAELVGEIAQKKYGLSSAAMILFTFSLSQRDGLLIHSSVVIKSHKGYLFLGASGSGKSTQSKLWLENFDDVELLNDDNPVLRIIDKKVYVFGTPWSGKTPCYINKSAIVSALILVKKSTYNIIQKQKDVFSFATMLSSTPSMIWDKKIFKSICNNVNSIIDASSFYTLKCLPNNSAAIMTYKTIKENGR